jgi:putative membrane protein
VPQLLLMLAISVLAVVTRGHLFGLRFHLDLVPFPLVGVSRRSSRRSQQRRVCALRGGAPDLGAHRDRRARPDVAGRTCLPEDGDGFERRLFVQRLIAFVYA